LVCKKEVRTKRFCCTFFEIQKRGGYIMNKKAKLATVVSLVLVCVMLAVFVLAAPKACNNGVDDDGDGLVDMADPGCKNKGDNTETSPNLVCDDGLDNDGDTFVDFPVDSGCSSPTDTSELGATECDDGVDNDGDTFVDFPADADCSGPLDNVEQGITDCSDGLDNDGDTLVDFPSDPGCSSAVDTSELGTAQCDDGVDNGDADSLADFPADPGCLSALDNDEADGQCDDGVDNADLDEQADFPEDLGCVSFSDNDETGACEDGLDNDGDGHIDWNPGAVGDTGCYRYADNDESPRDFCNDSDFGQSYLVQGTASGEDNNKAFSYTDSCVDANVLEEWHCLGKAQDYAVDRVLVDCSLIGNGTGCFNGACS
jgi:hypothetical protein